MTSDTKPPIIQIKNPCKLLWAGDKRVEPFMHKIKQALDRSGLKGQKRTDVYNRAYMAVYEAIKKYDTTQSGDVLIISKEELERMKRDKDFYTPVQAWNGIENYNQAIDDLLEKLK